MKNIAISENHLFKKVYAKGAKAVCKHIVVYVLTDYHASRLQRENPLKKRINRVGLTVSTRLGKAVVRSRVRRILRAAYQKLETERNIKKGKLIVITEMTYGKNKAAVLEKILKLARFQKANEFF